MWCCLHLPKSLLYLASLPPSGLALAQLIARLLLRAEDVRDRTRM